MDLIGAAMKRAIQTASIVLACLLLSGCASNVAYRPVPRAFFVRFNNGVQGGSNGPKVKFSKPMTAIRLPFGTWEPGDFVIREDRIGFGYRYTIHPVVAGPLTDGSYVMQGKANAIPDPEHLTPENYIGVAYPLNQ